MMTRRKGTFTGFARGVYATGTGVVIDGVRAVTGSVNGIQVGDTDVENSLVNGHGGGITAGKNAKIVGNTLSGNTGSMIVVSDGSIVKDNIVTLNTGTGGAAIQGTRTVISLITLRDEYLWR